MEYSISAEESVVEALARSTTECNGCTTCKYDPTQAIVDGDALNALFGSPLSASPEGDRQVSIDTDRCTVTIYGGDRIMIQPFSESEGPSPRATARE